VIVAVGRGIKSKDNLVLAEKLAAVLGGDLAASRPILRRRVACRSIVRSDHPGKQWLRSFMSPWYLGRDPASRRHEKLRHDRAINKDSGSADLDIADYGIVGDLFEAVPVLTERSKSSREFSRGFTRDERGLIRVYLRESAAFFLNSSTTSSGFHSLPV